MLPAAHGRGWLEPVVHGLVAVRTPGRGAWARQDVRGNKPGADARFSSGPERPTWNTRLEFSELNYPVLYTEPNPAVLRAPRAARDLPQLARTLPAAL